MTEPVERKPLHPYISTPLLVLFALLICALMYAGFWYTATWVISFFQ